MNNFKYIFTIIISLIFILYWGTTCIFNFPESSIIIAENNKEFKKFNNFFYQKWSFFAPPPSYNTRLYYVFHSKKGVRHMEIFENLNKTLRDKYLFNDTYANASWLLFSNVDNITETMVELIEAKSNLSKFVDENENKDLTDYVDENDEYDQFRSIIEKTHSMNIILHYSEFVAKQMKLGEDYKVQVIISKKLIPKYADRYKTDLKTEEKVLFVSGVYDNLTKKWINKKDLNDVHFINNKK